MLSEKNDIRNLETTQEYREGFPEKKGWYDCLIDGEIEARLYCFICEMNRRKRYWVEANGDRVLDPVTWRN